MDKRTFLGRVKENPIVWGSGTRWVSLPQKLIVTPDTYVDELDATTGWAPTNGTLELNNTEYKSGTGSLKLTSNVGAITSILKSATLNLLSDNGLSLGLWVYAHSVPTTTFTYIRVSAFTGAGYGTYVYKTFFIGGSLIVQNNWVFLGNVVFTVGAGVPDLGDIRNIQVTIGTVAGQTAICSFDLITAGSVTKPAVMIMFDDNIESTYTKAFPYLKAKNMVATIYTPSDLIGDVGYINSSQLLDLNAHNWNVGNHTKTHANLNLLTQQQVIDELEACKVVFDNLGLTRASNHVAYPLGNYNATVLAALLSWGAKTGRSVGDNSLNVYNKQFPYKLISGNPHNTTTLAVVKARIDSVIALQNVCAIGFHDLVDADPSVDTNWLVSDFKAVIDYIESLGLQTLTIDEYFRLYSGPITVHHK